MVSRSLSGSNQLTDNAHAFKALSIAKHFFVVRLLLPVHSISAPISRNIHDLNWLGEAVLGVNAHTRMGYCEYKVQAILNLKLGRGLK